MPTQDGFVGIHFPSRRMLESILLTDGEYNFPCNTLEEDQLLLINLPDSSNYLVVQGLELQAVSCTWYEKERILVNISSERFVHELRYERDSGGKNMSFQL